MTKNPAPFGQRAAASPTPSSARIILVARGDPDGGAASASSSRIYVSQFAPPRMAAVVRFAMDILNGVPTIVVGIFVFALLVSGRSRAASPAAWRWPS